MAPVAMMAPWPGHQARVGGHGADGAGIGQRNGGALKIGGGEAAGAGARHQVVEGGQVLLEIQRAGVLDVGHHQAAAPSLPATSTAMPRLICGCTTR